RFRAGGRGLRSRARRRRFGLLFLLEVRAAEEVPETDRDRAEEARDGGEEAFALLAPALREPGAERDDRGIERALGREQERDEREDDEEHEEPRAAELLREERRR